MGFEPSSAPFFHPSIERRAEHRLIDGQQVGDCDLGSVEARRIHHRDVGPSTSNRYRLSSGTRSPNTHQGQLRALSLVALE
jgi:hypothetical protein